MTKELEQELTKQLKDDIGKIVIKYAELRLDPDILSAYVIIAGMKVTSAYCSATLKAGEMN